MRSLEYLGSDLVLRCSVGDELVTVRADGRSALTTGAQVMLQWSPHEQHFFDQHGTRSA